MTFSARPYRPEDEPGVLSLLERLWPVQTDREFFWANHPQDGGCCRGAWVACQDGKVIGVARLDVSEYLRDDSLGWITVSVAPEFQRQGIGRLLADLAEARARELAQRTVQTSVDAALDRMGTFWAARGYTEVRRTGTWLAFREAPLAEPLPDGLTVLSLDEFLARPDAAAQLATPCNAWSRDFHAAMPTPLPPAADLGGDSWHDDLSTCADPEHSLVALVGGRLHSLAVLGPHAEDERTLEINLDFTFTAPEFRALGEVRTPLTLVARAVTGALASGTPRVLVAAHAHVPWTEPEFRALGAQPEPGPVWMVLARALA